MSRLIRVVHPDWKSEVFIYSVHVTDSPSHLCLSPNKVLWFTFVLLTLRSDNLGTCLPELSKEKIQKMNQRKSKCVNRFTGIEICERLTVDI